VTTLDQNPTTTKLDQTARFPAQFGFFDATFREKQYVEKQKISEMKNKNITLLSLIFVRLSLFSFFGYRSLARGWGRNGRKMKERGVAEGEGWGECCMACCWKNKTTAESLKESLFSLSGLFPSSFLSL